MIKLIIQLVIIIIGGLTVTIISTWLFQPDVFKHGIMRMDLILLIKFALLSTGLGVMFYGMWAGAMTIKRLIINNKIDIYYKKLIQDMQNRHDANDVIKHNLFEEEKKAIRDSIKLENDKIIALESLPNARSPMDNSKEDMIKDELYKQYQNQKKKEGDKMNLIGKKVVLKIGGEPPKDDPNEIVGDKTVVHVPASEVGKYNKIVGLESKLIIGGEDKKE
jgi:hypothetical protein